MQKLSLLILCCWLTLHGASQIEFERQVLSPFAMNGTVGGINVCSTGGQVEYTTEEQMIFAVTQGFEQPKSNVPMTVAYSVHFDPCAEQYIIRLDSTGGCAEGEAIQIYWGTFLGDSLFSAPGGTVSLNVKAGVACSHLTFIDLDAIGHGTETCELDFYNWLTPNGDQSNDTWIIGNIVNSAFAHNQVAIYNRWGVPVWKGSNYNNTSVVFEGRATNGENLPDGTYYYTVSTDKNEFKGYIELMR
jgi:gliding motility-associated-like protein